MKRQTVAVTLKSGATHYVLIQNSLEYLDMQDELADVGSNEELKRREKIKAGISIKLAAGLCDADGKLLFADRAEALAFMATVQMRDINVIIDALNQSNALTDEAVEATEKK